jgi:hypothetical protein
MLEQHLVVRMGRSKRDELAAEIVSDKSKLNELIHLVCDGTQTQRMKGAWVLSGIHALNRSILIPYHAALIAMLNVETVGGVKRELLRSFEKCKPDERIASELIMLAMEWVTDDKQDLAVRYVCHRLLTTLLADYPELEWELKQKVNLYREKFGRYP